MIEVEGLVRVLGSGKDAKRILDGMSFTAQEGVVTGLLGPNGAGKTTTMRVLSTLLRPTEGTAKIAGHDVVDEADEVRAAIGLVTEEPGLVERLTPREQLTFAGRAHGMSTELLEQRLADLSRILGCDPHLDKRSGQLSKGNRQKVALLRALLHDPPVLLLDEPTANLDVVATEGIHELLTRPEVRKGKTILLSSHSLDEIDRLSDRVVGIVAGKVVADGTRDEIAAADPSGSFRQAFVNLLGQASLVAQKAEDDKQDDAKAADDEAPAKSRFGRR